MINGEGTEEKPSSAVASPCDRESDGGDDLSHYSSCGGESEFERYCSASSAMGTPSFRSNSFQDSDVWSLKNFKLGGESSLFKTPGVERVLSAYQESELGSGFPRGNLNGRVEGFVVKDAGLEGDFDVDDNFGNNIGIKKEYVESNEGRSGISGGLDYEKWIDKGEDLRIDGGEGRDLSDASEASSRTEHSEGEDSMFGCGSDDERRRSLYFGESVPYRGGERQRNENPLVMNSAVAFGSDDWNDFEQESTLGSMVWDMKQDKRQACMQNGIESSSFNPTDSVSFRGSDVKGHENEFRSIPAACDEVGAAVMSLDRNINALSLSSIGPVKHGWVKDVKGVPASSNEVSEIDELAECLGYNPDYNIFQRNKDPVEMVAKTNEDLKVGVVESETETTKVMATHHDTGFKSRDLSEANIESDPLCKFGDGHHHLVPGKDKETRDIRLPEDGPSFASSSLNNTTSNVANKADFSFSFDQIEDHFVPDKMRDNELNDFYDEIVDDMKDILLDSAESMGSRFAHGNRVQQPHFHLASRDGGSSASTSGTDYTYKSMQQSRRINRIEVVGARQKKGDVSFGERLVGVQKYTVYMIRVWSGENNWEVERRYRDFSALYFRLKKLFAERGMTLPSPWSSVERESRKLFGNASVGVVADRSVLIQECLQSVIHPNFFATSHNVLLDFLSPSEGEPDSPASDMSVTQLPFPNAGSQTEDCFTLGQTVSLVVQIQPPKSMKQLLDAQHYRCAGCHKNFDDGKTRVQEFVQALGWGKPRLCEYSGQLFCSSCHNNDYAVLPARVLHNWDFTRYPVSQLAKSFLDSISDKPMLCVSAVNPFLFSKVPTLQHMTNIRNKIRAMIPYVRCPFRRSIYKGLGSRKYILDSSDFFALRDLIDLSKGVFSALPAMVETVLRKIQEHITVQCLVCYDVGIPCCAQKDCDNPLSLIFPFQEGEAEKCRSCKSVFHQNCFKKIASCPCGVCFKKEEVVPSADEGIPEINSNSNLLKPSTKSSNGLLVGLFSKVMPGRSSLRRIDSKGNDNVILMGSLPNMSL